MHSRRDWVQLAEGAFEVTRWRQHGLDRVYVARPDGSRVGWWDVQAQEAHPERRADEATLVGAIDRWLADAHERVGGTNFVRIF